MKYVVGCVSNPAYRGRTGSFPKWLLLQVEAPPRSRALSLRAVAHVRESNHMNTETYAQNETEA